MTKQAKKKCSISTVLLLVIGIGCIAVGLWMIVPILMDYQKSNATYANLESEYVKILQPNIETEINANWWYEDVDIQLSELQQINDDIIGWIRFDNLEKISYPILYSGDDITYLRSDIYGNESTAGCIFMEGLNSSDFEDCHTIIYGHNMRNLSMFGSLKKYKEEGFYEDNQYFTIYTENMAYRYQIFAYRDVSETSDVYSIGYVPGEQFETFVKELIRSSYVDTGVEVKKDDKVITLSTCSTTGNRFVVHAVRVGEHEYSADK